MPGKRSALVSVFVLSAVLLAGLGSCGQSAPQELLLATTTSTADSGLLEAILPGFESRYNAKVNVVAVGTGQALEMGRNGDADVLLVHDRKGEDTFVAEGQGTARYDVMFNDYILVGPGGDPAGILGLPTAAEALTRIAEKQAAFASRGDDSGTHRREKSLWQAAGIEPAGDWYLSVGQGMGSTLTLANEKGTYALTDRGTFLSMRANLGNLEILVGGASIAENQDTSLLNPYGVIPVSPAQHPHVHADLAQSFVDWLTSVETQKAIAGFGVDRYGQPLFYPGSQAWRAANP